MPLKYSDIFRTDGEPLDFSGGQLDIADIFNNGIAAPINALSFAMGLEEPEAQRETPGYTEANPDLGSDSFRDMFSGAFGPSGLDLSIRNAAEARARARSYAEDDDFFSNDFQSDANPAKSISPGKITHSGGGGDRVTSYGYRSDSTPDSNSSAGIGAWVSSAEAARIKRGEMTPNRLRNGDLAVSPDVEKRFRAAGIRPGAHVTLELDDGTSHTGRWMDRTAASYNGRALTGRFDIYSPGKPSPLNDRKVKGFGIAGEEKR